MKSHSLRCGALALAAAVFFGSSPSRLEAQESTKPPAFAEGFEHGSALPAGWTSQGDVTIDTTNPFKDNQSLELSRTQADAEKPCFALSPTFGTKPGLWNLTGGIRPDLYSPDSSFDCLVALECLDAKGQIVDTITISDVFGKNGWNSFGGQYEIPERTVASRFRISLNKTYGHIWVDDLAAAYAGKAPYHPVERLVFTTAALGNLLYPQDSRVVKLLVRAPQELPPESRCVNFTVCDYWGAEQMAPRKVLLESAPAQKNFFCYQGSIDLADVHLQGGKFYEMIGEVPLREGAYRNHSGLAILPEAVTNSYPPEDIPFSGRNWDGRMPATFDLSHRMGIRIMNIWSGWSAEAPYEPQAPCIDLARKYNMGVIFGMDSAEIETHSGDWRKLDEKALREGTRNLLTTYGKLVHPVYVSLGNEPPVLADRIPADVQAYKAVYEATKAVDPAITVIGTSVGPVEDFFQAGFGKYCDVYDFHCYEDAANITLALQNYARLFQRYGDPKPIWSTEIGLNSEGVSRHTVAIDMVKKYAAFFAGGGANMSWFDLFWPDEDGKNYGSNGESFDVFDSRYLAYNPKLTAISDYDLINGIAIKKFVAQKDYGDVHAFLFRDQDNHDLQIIWKGSSREDAFVPLPGARDVTVVKLDGEHRPLNAGGSGVTLSLSTEPLMLFYDGTAPLAAGLDDPVATLAAVPATVVRGGSFDLTVNAKGIAADKLTLQPPPLWQVTASVGQGTSTFHATAPLATNVREAEMTVAFNGEKAGSAGELYFRVPVAPQIATQLLPEMVNGTPAVQLLVKNNGTQKQSVDWSIALTGQIGLEKGEYNKHEPSQAHFTAPARGSVSLQPDAQTDIVLPIAQTDPLTVYRVKADITDANGTTASRERNVAGFVQVPKVTGKITLDGNLDEPDWARAPVEKFDQERQYFSFEPATLKWKGPADLSGTMRFLWDENYLYVGVEVTDDIAGAKKEDAMLWDQDGLQFLIDPCRGRDESTGKYDYSIAEGLAGLHTWCNLTADAGAPIGLANDVKVSAKRRGDGSGSITYEVAFPWSRLAPFKPGPNADLGLTMILNEDDGNGRKSYMTWFGNAASKETEPVGDLILRP
jgi:hypothetical protein